MSFLVAGGSNLYRGDEVILAVGTLLSDGQWRAGENDGLRQILQHIGQGRGGVGHCIRTVQHHEAIVLPVVVGDAVAEICPQGGCHVAGIDGRIELEGLNTSIKLPEFRYIIQQVLEVEGFQGTRLRVTVHADGPAGIDQKYSPLHKENIYVNNLLQR